MDLQSVDLTKMAREGKLDPTIGRDEGKRCFDYFCNLDSIILSRDSANHPK